jgi:hypothetical protein
MVGRCGTVDRGRASRLPLLAVLAFRQQAGQPPHPLDQAWKIAAFSRIMRVLKGYSGISGSGVGQSVATADPRLSVIAGRSAECCRHRPEFPNLRIHGAPAGPVRKGDTIFQRSVFSALKGASGPCRPHPPSYMRLTVAISRVIDRLGVWIGVPSGPSQPAAKRRI